MNLEDNNNPDGNQNPDLTNQNNGGEGNQEPASNPDTEKVFGFLKENGFEVNSIEDLERYKTPQFIEKEVEKIVEKNPYADVLDEYDLQYLDFKKNTGRSRKDFDALQVDIDSISPIEFAREKIRRESGLKNLSNSDIDSLLEEELGIDLDDLDSVRTKVKLNTYAKEIKEERKRLQEEYKKPIETKNKPFNENDFVTLENGAIFKKDVYEKMAQDHQEYLQKNSESVNSVTASSFNITIDENGSKREIPFGYEYSEQDKQSMLSITSDTQKTIQERYVTDKGFDHAAFNEDLWWSDPNNRIKAVQSMLQTAIAEGTEGALKQRGNVNLTHNPLPSTESDKVKHKSLDDFFAGR